MKLVISYLFFYFFLACQMFSANKQKIDFIFCPTKTANTDTTKIYDQIERFRLQNDTVNVIKKLIVLSDIKKNQEDYNSALNYLWQAKILCGNSINNYSLIKINHELGVIHNILNRPYQALSFFKEAVNIIESNDINNKLLNNEYFSIAVSYYNIGNWLEALKYINKTDSITVVKSYYSISLRGAIFTEIGKIDEAKILLKKSINIAEKEKSHYLVIIYMYYANLCVKLNQYNEAIEYYNKSIDISNKYKCHVNIKQFDYRKLSEEYFKKKDIYSAYLYLGKYMKISDKLYSSSSDNMQQVFDIKDKYTDYINNINSRVNEQKIALTNKELSITRFKYIIILALFILFTVVSLLIFFYNRKILKHKREQKELQIKKNKEKADEIINIKNKELTIYMLKLIDKDNVISDILKYLKSIDFNSSELKSIVNRDENLWEEFNTRFLSVNSNFYDKLINKHPLLTKTDLKYCALIKLSFSSKDMSRLLNISVESVEVSRHRIRKKMGLDRTDSLSSYLSNF